MDATSLKQKKNNNLYGVSKGALYTMFSNTVNFAYSELGYNEFTAITNIFLSPKPFSFLLNDFGYSENFFNV